MSAAVTCFRCGHSSDWHRLDDSTSVSPVDPDAKFRCLGYDCAAAGPVPPGGRACDCPDMVRPSVVEGVFDEWVTGGRNLLNRRMDRALSMMRLPGRDAEDVHCMCRPSVCPTCDGKGWVMTPDTVGRAFAAVMEHGRGAGVPHLLCPECRSEVADREATS